MGTGATLYRLFFHCGLIFVIFDLKAGPESGLSLVRISVMKIVFICGSLEDGKDIPDTWLYGTIAKCLQRCEDARTGVLCSFNW